MAIHPYLFFSGTCREALTRYHEILGGDLALQTMSEAPPEAAMPGAPPDMIMHAALTFDSGMLMASDDPTGDGGPMKGVAVSYSTSDVAEAERVFSALAEGGQVTMPLSPTFWSPSFGMCVDRFGTSWMVSADAPESS